MPGKSEGCPGDNHDCSGVTGWTAAGHEDREATGSERQRRHVASQRKEKAAQLAVGVRWGHWRV